MFPAATARYASVIVPVNIPKTLSWEIPGEFADVVKPGMRVEVQVGQRKRYAGVVTALHQSFPVGFEAKPIISVIDEEPVVYENQIELWRWMASYYACSEGDVMAAALPSHLKLTGESIVQYNEGHAVELTALSDKEFLLADALEIKQRLNIGEIQAILETHHIYPTVRKLVDKGLASIYETMPEKYKERKQTYIVLNAVYRNEEKLEELVNEWSKAPKQLDLLLAFLHLSRTEGDVVKADLLKKANASSAVLEGLIKKNILHADVRSIDRLPVLPKQLNVIHQLSGAQQNALDDVYKIFTTTDVCLLHGITGSGKTELYFELIAAAVRRGEQCLFLLPEIALTSQIIRRLQTHFGGYAGIYHSRFNANERVELWNKVKSGELQIVLGPRSALFLPFTNLKLIIVDEEHDTSYKQIEPAPRYHARDAAIHYAQLCKAKVLLGSATPSLESYHNAVTGKFGLVELNERFNDAQLPAMQIIDLRQAVPRYSNRPMLTQPMQDAIATELQNERQIIVFQNRRGYTPYQVCNTCGWIPRCEQCDVSLTFHKSLQKLKCHYCGRTYSPAKDCAQCGSQQFREQSFGTERLEELLDESFKDAVVARMDTDSVKGKHAHENIIRQFEEQRLQILVGTQMVVKGLDFDHVGLVCIPDADGIFGFADFRVNERAFQLIEQVSGRAGRKGEAGKVMLQLYNTQHPVIPFLLQHNYRMFYNWEIENRKQFFYPPFTRLIIVQCKHVQQGIAMQAAEVFAEWVRTKYASYIQGPAEPPVNRIRNQFIAECLLKLPRNKLMLQQVKQHLRNGIVELQHQKPFRQVSIVIDVDPQ